MRSSSNTMYVVFGIGSPATVRLLGVRAMSGGSKEGGGAVNAVVRQPDAGKRSVEHGLVLHLQV